MDRGEATVSTRVGVKKNQIHNGFFGLIEIATLRQTPRYPLEHVDEDPVVVEGDRKQV